MRRLLFIVAVLLVVAVAEIAVLIAVAHAVGLGWTLLLVLGTSALGGWLLRREGARAWRAFRADLAEGRPPGNAGTEGLLVFLGGILMLVPGFVTAVIGALLLIPPIRRLARVLVSRAFGDRISPAAATSLFGPRRVRVSYPRHPDPPAGEPSSDHSRGRDTIVDAEPIEGEIIDPR